MKNKEHDFVKEDAKNNPEIVMSLGELIDKLNISPEVRELLKNQEIIQEVNVLSNKRRQKILELVSKKPHSIKELVNYFKSNYRGVYRHVKLLHKYCYVELKKEKNIRGQLKTVMVSIPYLDAGNKISKA